MKPRLRSDTFYVSVQDGVLFRGNRGSLILKGTAIYTWVERILPFLDGSRTLDALCRGLTEERASVVRSIVERLLRAGLIQDASDEAPHNLSKDELATYEAQIAYIDSFVDSARARFERFRNSSIVLIGFGRSLVASARAFLECGLRRLHIVLVPEAETDIAKLQDYVYRSRQRDGDIECLVSGSSYGQEDLTTIAGRYDLVIHVGDWPVVDRIVRLNRYCKQSGKTFIQGMVVSPLEAVVGPIVSPESPGCWECFWLEYSPARDFKGHMREGSVLSFTAAGVIAALTAFDIFNYVTEAQAAVTLGNVRLVDLSTLGNRAHRLAYPLCESCSRTDEASAPNGLEEHSQEEFVQSASQLIDKRLGPILYLGPGDLGQIPLAQCKAQVVMLADSATSHVEALEPGIEYREAHYWALRKACELYASQNGNLTPFVAPAAAEYLQVQKEPPEDRPVLAPALVSKQLVPLPSTNGWIVASGHSYDEMIARGILAARHHAVAHMLTTAKTVSAFEVPLASDEMSEHLSSMARGYGFALKSFDLSPEAGIPTIGLCTDGRIFDIASGFSLQEAMHNALIRIVHGFQQGLGRRTASVGPMLIGSGAKRTELAIAPSASLVNWDQKARWLLDSCRTAGREILFVRARLAPVVQKHGLFVGHFLQL